MDIQTLNAVIAMFEQRMVKADQKYCEAKDDTEDLMRYCALVESQQAVLAVKDMLAEELYRRTVEMV
jgi:hypothetical protein